MSLIDACTRLFLDPKTRKVVITLLFCLGGLFFWRPQPGLAARMPEALVAFAPEAKKAYALVVEKSSQQLFLFEHNDQGTRQIRQWPCSTGEVDGPKTISGDKKTPEGIYFFTDRFHDQDLSAIYGTLALPLDYPNFLDRRDGKNGSAIWLHGTNKKLVPRDTNGCIALQNAHINELSPYISLNRTPVIVQETIRWTDTPPEKTAARVRRLLQQWQQSLTDGPYHDYLRFYDATYLPDMRWWEKWRQLRRDLPELFENFEIEMAALSIFKHGHNLVALFDQTINTGQAVTFLGRRKLFLRQLPSQLTLIGDTFQAGPGQPGDRQPKEHVLLAASRRLKQNRLIERDILDLIDKWLTAWNKMDAETYGACYASDFKAKGMNRRAWINYKKNLEKQYSAINVAIKDPRFIKKNQDTSMVTFVQHYQSDQYQDKGIKTLILKNKGQQWKIYRELWEEQ